MEAAASAEVNVEIQDDLNLYTYVGNDPLDRTDPTGNQSDPDPEGLEEGALATELGIIFEEVLGGGRAAAPAEAEAAGSRVVSKASGPYQRPSGATTPAQRAFVQGKPCVKCGATTERQVAGHKKALVEEHHETGTIDKEKMKGVGAIQPECPICSAKEGAEMSRYSRKLNRTIEPPPPPPPPKDWWQLFRDLF